LVWISKLSRLRFVDCATKPMEGGQRGTRIKIWRLALRLEISHARVFQSGLKTVGGVLTGGASGIIAEVALRGS
jgi:hypothetical protein